jgi:hypothetical protein
MQRPWVDWSRRRFLWTGLAAWAALLVARFVLMRVADSTALRAIIWTGFAVGLLMLFYLTFTWAKEYDRRNPRP